MRGHRLVAAWILVAASLVAGGAVGMLVGHATGLRATSPAWAAVGAILLGAVAVGVLTRRSDRAAGRYDRPRSRLDKAETPAVDDSDAALETPQRSTRA